MMITIENEDRVVEIYSSEAVEIPKEMVDRIVSLLGEAFGMNGFTEITIDEEDYYGE